MFVPESATASSDGRRVNVESGHSVEWVEEENYIFTPGRAEDKLLQWLEGEAASGCVVTPKERLHEVKQMLLKGCPQVSVSRPAARLSWGIPVPDDASQTMYALPCRTRPYHTSVTPAACTCGWMRSAAI